MPILETGGAMTIVAHQDDDILFMNPDILASIEAGVPNTTIYVTAGDSGLGEEYWREREEGAKAAYLEMAGGGTWVDETISVEINGQTFEIASSYLAENPGIRLYFLRLPDGGGMLEPAEYEQLARLESGDLQFVTTIDGANTYSRADLVDILTLLMDMHAPGELRFQVADGAFAGGEHTDHVHTTQFAEEALANFSGESYSVTHYVQYQSGSMPANLSVEDAARALEIMEAYAAHDLAVLDEWGQLAQVYVDWTGRLYVAEQYTVNVGGDPTGPADPGTFGVTYSLEGPDAFLFTVDAATGAIAPQDWFVPSLDDAWDQNGDFIYEITLVATPDDGGTPTGQNLSFETTAEGVLTELDQSPGGETPTDPTDPTDPADPGTVGVTYSLEGPDAFLFTVDAATGAIAPQDWFVPSLDDAWDQNGDFIYEIILVATPDDGGTPTGQNLSFETTAEGVLTGLDQSPGGETPTDPTTSTDPTTPTDPTDPGTDPGTGDVIFSLAGPDAFLFIVDAETGAVTPQDWFIPSLNDAWDQNEDFIYEITLWITPVDGGMPTEQDLWYETTANGVLTELG